MKIAVVGAGCSGLVTLKYLLDIYPSDGCSLLREESLGARLLGRSATRFCLHVYQVHHAVFLLPQVVPGGDARTEF